MVVVESIAGPSRESAVSRLSKFSADASHNLRTSITVILATAQLSLDRRRSEEEYQSDLERIVSECQIASTMLDALLSLARSGHFVHEVAFHRINLTELAVAGCRRVEDLAESRDLLDWRLPPEDLLSRGMSSCCRGYREFFWIMRSNIRRSTVRFLLKAAGRSRGYS